MPKHLKRCGWCGDPCRGWFCGECWRLAIISAVSGGAMALAFEYLRKAVQACCFN